MIRSVFNTGSNAEQRARETADQARNARAAAREERIRAEEAKIREKQRLITENKEKAAELRLKIHNTPPGDVKSAHERTLASTEKLVAVFANGIEKIQSRLRKDQDQVDQAETVNTATAPSTPTQEEDSRPVIIHTARADGGVVLASTDLIPPTTPAVVTGPAGSIPTASPGMPSLSPMPSNFTTPVQINTSARSNARFITTGAYPSSGGLTSTPFMTPSEFPRTDSSGGRTIHIPRSDDTGYLIPNPNPSSGSGTIPFDLRKHTATTPRVVTATGVRPAPGVVSAPPPQVDASGNATVAVAAAPTDVVTSATTSIDSTATVNVPATEVISSTARSSSVTTDVVQDSQIGMEFGMGMGSAAGAAAGAVVGTIAGLIQGLVIDPGSEGNQNLVNLHNNYNMNVVQPLSMTVKTNRTARYASAISNVASILIGMCDDLYQTINSQPTGTRPDILDNLTRNLNHLISDVDGWINRINTNVKPLKIQESSLAQLQLEYQTEELKFREENFQSPSTQFNPSQSFLNQLQIWNDDDRAFIARANYYQSSDDEQRDMDIYELLTNQAYSTLWHADLREMWLDDLPQDANDSVTIYPILDNCNAMDIINQPAQKGASSSSSSSSVAAGTTQLIPMGGASHPLADAANPIANINQALPKSSAPRIAGPIPPRVVSAGDEQTRGAPGDDDDEEAKAASAQPKDQMTRRFSRSTGFGTGTPTGRPADRLPENTSGYHRRSHDIKVKQEDGGDRKYATPPIKTETPIKSEERTYTVSLSDLPPVPESSEAASDAGGSDIGGSDAADSDMKSAWGADKFDAGKDEVQRNEAKFQAGYGNEDDAVDADMIQTNPDVDPVAGMASHATLIDYTRLQEDGGYWSSTAESSLTSPALSARDHRLKRPWHVVDIPFSQRQLIGVPSKGIQKQRLTCPDDVPFTEAVKEDLVGGRIMRKVPFSQWPTSQYRPP